MTANLIAPKDLTGYLIGKSSGTSKTSFGDSDTAVNNIALFHWLIRHTSFSSGNQMAAETCVTSSQLAIVVKDMN